MSTVPDSLFDTFLATHLDVVGYLCLEDAQLDGDAFSKAQEQTRKGPKAKRAKAAEKLAAMLADVHCPSALDQVVASAFDRADRWADALEVRRRALSLGGAWHAVHAGRLVGNVGFDLQKLGDLSAATAWYDRALTFDPTNPFVIASLAEVALDGGDLPAAFSMHDYLQSLEFPPSFAEEFVARMKKARRPAQVPVYTPDLSRLRPLPDEAYVRYATALAFDRNTSMRLSLRGHAVACAMRGDFAHARLCAELAVEQTEEAGSDSVAERQWATALVRALSSKGAALDHDPEKRVAAAAGRPEALRAALHDPNRILRLHAAELLGPDPLGDLLLCTQANLESHRGIDYRHPARIGPTATRVLRARRVKAAGPRPPIVIPSEGADHPVFAKLEKGEALAVWMAWDEPINKPLADRFSAALAKAAKRCAAADPKAAVHQSVDLFSVGLFVLNAENEPRAAIRALLEEIAGVGESPGESSVAPREVIAARLTISKTGGIAAAVPDPRMKVDDELEEDDARWAAAFAPARKPPPSEPEGGLFLSIPGPKGQNVPELRLMPLYFPDVRVVYGLPEVTDRAPTPRRDDVAQALVEALDVRFRGVPPTFWAKERAESRVDAIESSGRPGYAFALSGLTADMVVFLPNTARLREYELFSAVVDLVRKLSLAPVVHWYRGGGTWIVNLWEPTGA